MTPAHDAPVDPWVLDTGEVDPARYFGITLANGGEVLAAGADSVAIISDLLTDSDVSTRVRQFLSSRRS